MIPPAESNLLENQWDAMSKKNFSIFEQFFSESVGMKI